MVRGVTAPPDSLTRLRPTPAHDPDRTHRAPEGWWTGSPQWIEPIPAAEPAETPRSASAPVGERRFTRKHVMVAAGVVLLAALVATYSLLSAKPSEPVPVAQPVPEAAPVAPGPGTDATPTPSVPARIRVHVTGAVNRPGVLELDAEARVIDAVDQAGGLTADAAPGQLNFAQPLADGQQIWIGTQAEPGGEVRSVAGEESGSGTPAPGADGGGGEAGLVNLNTAGQAELEELPGVGPTTAQKIITWREENGGFRSVEDLMEIRGIGEKTFAELAPLVTV